MAEGSGFDNENPDLDYQLDHDDDDDDDEQASRQNPPLSAGLRIHALPQGRTH